MGRFDAGRRATVHLHLRQHRNRKEQKDGGDESGANLRSTTYTANAANQYTSYSMETVPNTMANRVPDFCE